MSLNAAGRRGERGPALLIRWMGNLVTIRALGRRGKRHTWSVKRDGQDSRPRTPEEERDDLLAYAFRALGGRALTRVELRQKLQRRSENEALIEEVLGRVASLGYQDDAHVAQAEGRRRSVGSFRVRQTLKRRGVGENLIAETVEARTAEDEVAAATDLLARRWGGFQRKADPRASAYAFLARRGFAGQAIWTAIREVAASQDSSEDDPDWEVDARPSDGTARG